MEALVVFPALAGLVAGIVLVGLAHVMEPPQGRRNRLLLAAAANVTLTMIFGALGLMLNATGNACGSGLECIGPAIQGGIQAIMAWSAGIGLLVAAGIGAGLAALRSRAPVDVA